MPNQRRLLSAPVHFMVPIKEADDGGREPNPREKICEAESESRGERSWIRFRTGYAVYGWGFSLGDK